jgi:riboflavin kinase/FMN adenylyltransferase
MQQLRLGAQAPLVWPEPCVAIGNFDGVHRGHQALVTAAVARARERTGTAVVLTFDPHPARVLAPARAPGALTTPAQKAELLEALGADVMAVLPFDEPLARLAPAEFVRAVLVGSLRARRVFVGAGFRFGHQQSGDVAALEALGSEHGFTVEAIAPVLEGGAPISSSRVRDALARGDVADARALLGRAYSIDGQVVAGERRGRAIGVPTANLASENEVAPARGVYAARCRVATGLPPEDGLPYGGGSSPKDGPPYGGGTSHSAVVNVGERPTFGGTTTTIEAHLLDFDGDLYGSGVRLTFEHWLRGERRFPGAEALVAQIRDDIARARTLLSGPPSEGPDRLPGDEPRGDGL